MLKKEDKLPEWAIAADEDYCITERLRVPGGWLYRTSNRFRRDASFAMCFVPEPEAR